MKRLFLILTTILCFFSSVFPCSMVQGFPFPFSAPEINSYIFVGEVIGYTDVIKTRNDGSNNPDKFWGEGRGYKIKPVEAINLPVPTDDYYELVTFGVTTWCAPQIRNGYLPIGTKIRIVAHEAKLLPNRNLEKKVRIETEIFDRLSIVSENDIFTTKVDSYFDYKNWKNLQSEVQKHTDLEMRSRFSDFMYVELNKDLLRLKKAKTEKERYEILNRLLYCPYIDFPRIIDPSLGQLIPSSFGKYYRMSDFQIFQPDGITSKNIQQKKLTPKEKELLKQREDIEKSDYFKNLFIFFIFEK